MDRATGTSEHMPFFGHRTMQEVIDGQYDQLAWCPPEYREMYRTVHRKVGSYPEARRIIEDHIAAISTRRRGAA